MADLSPTLKFQQLGKAADKKQREDIHTIEKDSQNSDNKIVEQTYESEQTQEQSSPRARRRKVNIRKPSL